MKNILYILFGVWFCLPIYAQKNDDFLPGIVVMNSGDTIEVSVKSAREDRLTKSITIRKTGSDDQEKLTPDMIKFFKIDNTSYSSLSLDGKNYFLKNIILGEASLYELANREKKGNKSVTVYQYYISKKGNENIQELKSQSFRSDMISYFKEYEALTQKIDERYYTFQEKEAMIEDYNQWVKQGKPGNTWRIDQGNFTRPEKEYIEKEPPVRKQSDYDAETYGSRWGIEVPTFLSYGFVSYPNELNLIVQSGGNGLGYDVGIGARVNVLPSLTLRAGIHFWNKGYQSNYLISVGSNPTENYEVNEYGTIHYGGMYGMIDYEMRNVIVGGGLSFSVWNTYNINYKFRNLANNQIIEEFNQKELILIDQFTNQFDFTFHFGYKINLLNKQLKLKPMFQYTMPLLQLFDYKNDLQGPVNLSGYSISGYLIQFGLITDIGFPVRKKLKPLFED